MAIYGQIIMVLMDSGFNRETLANNLLLDQVSLYSASPSQSQKLNEDGNDDYHFFYKKYYHSWIVIDPKTNHDT